MNATALTMLSGILVAGFICQWLAWRIKLPSILLLLLVGITLGPLLGWLDPDALFGDLLKPVVSMAVAIILYEGSLTLKISDIRGHGKVVRNLVTIGLLITWFIASASAAWLLGWDLLLAALFGAIVTVSGPTVIIPLIRSIRPTKSVSAVMRWEGILVDPLGAILAVLVFDFIVVTQTAATPGQLLSTFGLIVAGGVGLGVVAGHAFGIVLRKHWLPDYLRDFAALAAVILVFSLAESMAHESGLLTVTVMGVWQANMRNVDFEDILDFKESLTLVLVAGLFIVLAARIDLEAVMALGGTAVVLLLVLQFIGGPLRAFTCSIGSELKWQERALLGWIFPRGIVAAAVSALFALRLEEMGYPGADKLVPMVFTVIVGTVVIQSLSGRLIASWLGIRDPDPTGVLVVGANPVARFYGKALQEAGHRVLLASMNWRGISKARMAGLPVFYGSAVSSYGERHMNLLGLGKLLALSYRPGLNELACVKYRYEFGMQSVYTVRQSDQAHEKHQISGEAAGRLLMDGTRTIEDLEQLVHGSPETRTTEITDNFSIDDYQKTHPDNVILFVTSADGAIRFPLGDDRIKEGDRVTAVIQPAAQD
ncbi:MAG: sodium:proton antiporter [Xanthomonadales bacterium]|nr:sodium:proton antiporter [Xanthomonadales bacterium]